MKKVMKVLLVAIIGVMLISSFALANNYDIPSSGTQATQIKGMTNSFGAIVIDVVRTVGYVVAAVMVLVVAVQWMMAPASKRQELRGKLINVAIGVVLLVGGATLLGIVDTTANQIVTNPNSTQNVSPNTGN